MSQVVSEGLEDPLDDHSFLSQQLEQVLYEDSSPCLVIDVLIMFLVVIHQISQIGRCEYEKTCTLLVQLFDEAAQLYQKLISSGNTGSQLTVQEGICIMLSLHPSTACLS